VDQTNIFVSKIPKGHQQNTNISILKLIALNINSITDHFVAQIVTQYFNPFAYKTRMEMWTILSRSYTMKQISWWF